MPSKTFLCVCVCMYKMNTFTLFTAEAWGGNGVEAIEYGGEMWINQGDCGNLRALRALPIIHSRLTCLRALPIINTCLRALRTCAPLLTNKRLTRLFCLVLLFQF